MHMSETTESASGETRAEDSSIQHDEQHQLEFREKSNFSQPESSMLEDEEMPTYISVSSISKQEDVDAEETRTEKEPPDSPEDQSTRSPYRSDDQGGGGSVYVVSSSGEEENEQQLDMVDEEEEYEESEGMSDEEEEDDEDEESPINMHHNNDEDAETDVDFEPDRYERASDDFILRYSRKLKCNKKEKSLSMEDLTSYRNRNALQDRAKRLSLDATQQGFGIYQRRAAAFARPSISSQYKNVKSKVKQYIKDIKEQNRRSRERYLEVEEYEIKRNHAINKDSMSDEEVLHDNKNIRQFPETLHKISDYESIEVEVNHKKPNAILNGKSIGATKTRPDWQKNHKETPMEVENEPIPEKLKVLFIEEQKHRNGDMAIKDTNLYEEQYNLPNNKKSENEQEACYEILSNEHGKARNIVNARTLTYEQYMKGNTNSSHNLDSKDMHMEQANSPEKCDDVDIINIQEVHSININNPMNMESVKSIQVLNNGMVHDTKYANSAFEHEEMNKVQEEINEVHFLRMQLTEMANRYGILQETYQKTLGEKIKMKQEIDDLKKTVNKYEKERTREVKVAATQTDPIAETDNIPKSNVKEHCNNKVSIGSLDSASSNGHWTESACSVAISVKSPDITQISTSDSSFVGSNSTNTNTAPPFSRTFVTSSRILQTLSNMTQGKAKFNNLMPPPISSRMLNKKQKEQQNSDSIQQPSSSKKRKATEMLKASPGISQPSKILNTSGDMRRRLNNSEINDSFTTIANLIDPSLRARILTDSITSMNNTDSLKVQTDKTEDDDNDNIKCYVYQEDENNKNRSFLIQAEEYKNCNEVVDKNRIRECGPYLLGNIEVSMSEVNGIINIWGTEVNKEPVADDGLEASCIEEKAEDPHCDPRNVRYKSSPMVCSTHKKQRMFSKADELRAHDCPSISVLSEIRPHPSRCESLEKNSTDKTFNHSIFGKLIENGRQDNSASICKDNASSCCYTHQIEFTNSGLCGTSQQCNKHGCPSSYSREKLNPKRKFSLRNKLMSLKNTHKSNVCHGEDISENVPRTHACRCIPNEIDEDDQPGSTYCLLRNNSSHSCKSSPSHSNPHNSSKHLLTNDCECSCNSPNRNEDDPLISLQHLHESPEIRQRRLSGRKIRGLLMDLLRGCGECHNSSIASDHENGCCSSLTRKIDHMKEKEAFHSSMHQHSNSAESNDRCCHAYAKRIESQLEDFRREMERVLTRSDAILDMLQMLNTADMN
ncbi:repetitive organellar protein-like [Prorops nasuta]|uniref:repetitive organellar protein-like n=1 Tax=Prorops nasuta TaxID=863751 RepID=UPI0034CDF18A